MANCSKPVTRSSLSRGQRQGHKGSGKHGPAVQRVVDEHQARAWPARPAAPFGSASETVWLLLSVVESSHNRLNMVWLLIESHTRSPFGISDRLELLP